MRLAGFSLLMAMVLGPACKTSAVPLVCVSDLDHAPFATVSQQGDPLGFEVDLMVALAAELGRPLVWERLSFAELLPAVERGGADVACATLGVTPERAKRVLFTRPYFRTGIALIALEGAPGSLAALDGAAVGFSAGTTAEDAVREHLPRALAVPLAKGDSPIAALRAGQVVAVAIDAPDVDLLYGDAGVVALTRRLAGEDYALALPRTHLALRDALDEILLRWEEQGRLDELWRRYAPGGATGD